MLMPFGAPGAKGFKLLSSAVHIGKMTSGNGLNALFDGVVGTLAAAGAYTGGSGNLTADAGSDWGVGISKTVTRFTIFGFTDNYGFSNNANNLTFTYKLRGSPDSTTWTDLYSNTVVATNGVSLDVPSGITTTTAYRFHEIQLIESGTPAGGHAVGCVEVSFYETRI